MYSLYLFEDWQHFLNIPHQKLTKLVRNFNWQRGLSTGWLDYSLSKAVMGYGDGSLYTDDGESYDKLYKETAWKGSAKAANTTAVTKTGPLPEQFIKSGIMKAVRHFLRENRVHVDDSTCTGMWCDWYQNEKDNIAPRTDDEDYYARNLGQDTVFVSLNIFDNEDFGYYNLSRFQLEDSGKWIDIKLPHLSILVMSGSTPHRVLKAKINSFRPRFNIIFRTPVHEKMDIVKNYRFFSNFGRYYRQSYLLFLPEKAFLNKLPKEGEKLFYKEKNTVTAGNGERYKIINDDSYLSKAIRNHMYLSLNYSNLNREVLLTEIKAESTPPSTTTDISLLILKKQIKNT